LRQHEDSLVSLVTAYSGPKRKPSPSLVACNLVVMTAESLLIKVCNEGDLKEIQYLVQNFAVDPNHIDDDTGDTGLHLACTGGFLPVVVYLWTVCHVLPNVRSRGDDLTPLQRAISYGHLDVVEYLITQCGVDINVDDDRSSRTTILHIIAVRNRLDILKCLHNKHGLNIDVDRQTTPQRYTALFFAAQEGHYDMVKYLHKVCGADINLTDVDGVAPLTIALLNGRMRIVRFLSHRRSLKVPSVGRTVDGQSLEHLIRKNARRVLCAQGWCTERGTYACKRCQKFKYCSRECQREHWRAGHRGRCKKQVEPTE
jgi:ankyrin repeat protein